MISIIIPIYNASKYLKQCIDSIIQQTYTNWQLILIDDGSIDDSAKICDKYEQLDSRITVIHQSNKGVSAARNTGIEQAQGELLCFVDADDWLESTFLSNFDTAHIQVDFYISGWVFNIDDIPYSYIKYQTNYCNSIEQIRDVFLSQNLKGNGYPWGKLFKTSIIRNNHLKFNEKMSINEDHLFVLQYFLLTESIYITEKTTYQYRVFNETGQKLSEKKHGYTEYIENATCFKKVVYELKEKWSLCDTLFQNFILLFVFSKRLKAIESLILNGERNLFPNEITYWKKQKEIRFNTKLEAIIFIIIKLEIPLFVKWHILKVLYLFKSYYYTTFRNTSKKIQNYLQAISIRVDLTT